MNWTALTCDARADREEVRRSFEHCRQVVRREGSHFHHGMQLVAEPKRSATYALYAWLRRADDLADGEGDPAEKARRLGTYWAETQRWIDPAHDPIESRSGELLWPAFREAVLQYGLAASMLREHIEGQLQDQQRTSYATLAELQGYCHKVAAVVGLMCIRIWGYEGGEETCRLAVDRGVALQMTNILRDVREDALLGRVYVPAELLGGRTITPEAMLESRASDLADALQAMADHASACYAASAGLEQRVHPDGRSCLWAMTQAYSRLLDQIRRNPAVVLGDSRLRLGRGIKLWIAAQAFFRSPA